MSTRWEWLVGTRYLRSAHRRGFVSFVAAISVIGLLIFAGLTAYDTQNIKNTYIEHAAHGDEEWLGKSAIMGALNLYMNFINIFMFLLQFLGNRE